MRIFHVDPSINKAKTIHTDFYTSEDVFSAVKEKIFAKSMQFIGDMDLLPERSYAHPFQMLPELVDEPLFISRDNNDKVRCLSNVCTHRGNLLITKPGKLKKISCGYHGRMFSDDGKMTFMPEFDDVDDFPCANDHLTNLPVFKWGKLLFTSLNKNTDPSIFFSDMMKRMSFFPMDKLQRREDLSKDYYIETNWALYCENYLEGFHIPFVHEELNKAVDFSNYTTELFFPYSSLQLGLAKETDLVFDLPKDSPDYGSPVAAYYFWVYPNLMFNFYPWGLSLNIVQPLSVDKTKVSFITYILDESKYDQGAGGGLDKVELEDEKIVEQVQKGVKSRFYSQGRYSTKREKGTHHFHTILANAINK